MIQKFLVRKIIPAAGVAEAWVRAVRIAVVQIVIDHADQPIHAFRRKEVFPSILHGNLDGFVVGLHEADVVAGIQFKVTAVRI